MRSELNAPDLDAWITGNYGEDALDDRWQAFMDEHRAPETDADFERLVAAFWAGEGEREPDACSESSHRAGCGTQRHTWLAEAL